MSRQAVRKAVMADSLEAAAFGRSPGFLRFLTALLSYGSTKPFVGCHGLTAFLTALPKNGRKLSSCQTHRGVTALGPATL